MPVVSQLPARLDLLLVRGDTFIEDVILKDDTGTVINLTGYTVSVRQTGQTPLPLTVSIVAPATNGTIRLTCATTVISNPRRYEVMTTDSGGVNRTVLRGVLRPFGRVTD